MCTATDHDPQAIRSRKTARAQDTDPHSYCVIKTQTQRGFIEERTPLVKPSRTVEDDRDDAMSTPTQTMSAEKRKADGTAKDLRAPLPRTTSCHASSSRPDDESHDQLTRSTETGQNRKDES